MGILITILVLYGLLFISLYIHEVFHFPKKIVVLKWLPIPQMAAMGTKEKFRYTALAFNTSVALLIWYLNPSNIYLQWLGLINWIYIMIYFFLGSINEEIDPTNLAPKLRKFLIMDDIKNSHIWFFWPAAIFLFYYLKGYYLPILLNLIGGLI